MVVSRDFSPLILGVLSDVKEINVGAGFAVYMLNNIIDNVKKDK